MEVLLNVLKYVSQFSIITGLLLLIYWFNYTEEGSKVWKIKMKRLDAQQLSEKEKQLSDLNFISLVKQGSLLFKAWVILVSIFLLTILMLSAIIIL